MNTFANVFNMEGLVILLVIVLVLFGGSKIPEMMKGLGQGMREFKKGMNTDTEDDELRRDRLAREERERAVRERVEAEMRKEEEAKKGETLKQ